MEESVRKQARELLLKAKVYRFIASLFAVGGVALFLVLHYQFFRGDLLASLKDPVTIPLVLLPFIPSVVLSFRARKAERELRKLVGKKEE